MFQKLSIKWQLGISFAIVVGLFSVTLIGLGFLLSSLTHQVTQINDRVLPNVLMVDEMNLSRSEVQQFLTDVSATHDADGFKDAQTAAQLFQTNVDKFKQFFRQANDAGHLAQLERIEASFNVFYASGKSMAQAYMSTGMEAGNLLMKGSDKVAGFDQQSEVLSTELDKFRQSQIEEAQKSTGDALGAARLMTSGMVFGGLVAAVVAAIFGSLMVHSLLRQLGGEPALAAAIAKGVGAGDLTVPIDLRPDDADSLLAQLKTMQDSLIRLVANVRQGSDSVAIASREIASGNSDLSARTESQASALEQASASMEQLGATVKQNAENARQANQLAMDASAVAVSGGEVVAQVVDTMKHINDSSNQIFDIISVIDGIAFQTNILALNAAVEAARAGEQGRGFAVVASEVRSLAGRSAQAAKEIKNLITASVERVKQGTLLVDRAGATMTEVVSSIHRVTDLMGEISAASNAQSAGVSQVSEAVTHMDQVTQQNAALVEEMAAAAQGLQHQAQELVQMVAVFKLSGHAGR